MMRPKIVHLGEKIRALRWREKREKKKRRRRRKKEEGRIERKNPGMELCMELCLEHLLCLEIDIGWFGILWRYLFKLS